ncbi:carboxypeptidase-like regulatory domain-containing protein [Tellurirhabdus rosea]|uniref:carboxypeptidase-like regulatory domain-containing protein n=1 Tax=Tellurirhabdus rosea TaxID=2674997 RepID=UPI0022581849|nr:carboxypeptidase-like regulatory domain-containing protein [Tellurirhabdus rosea]
MDKYFTQRLCALCLFLLVGLSAFAQTRISGRITDGETKEGLAGVSIVIKGKLAGTITDTKGNFSLTTTTPPPLVIVISSVGYQTHEENVTSANATVNVTLAEQALLGQEVVVSASRVEENVLKSPVTVEKMDIRAIQNSPSPDFFGALANFKGIDVATQGLLFRSINMRGFGATGNPRTVQLIDGMDNSAPGLNFPIDNIVGIPEQDVESVEILPGAASALYGPNAIQGLILMNSKSPFLYQGVSANVKTGIMHADNRTTPTTGFYDASIRFAKAFNNKFAFKLNASYIAAQDWQATDYTNLNSSDRTNNPDAPNRGPGIPVNYDGMNVYGDEAQANMRTVAQGLIANTSLPQAQRNAIQTALNAGLIPNVNVSRTGWRERDLVDYNTKSLKLNAALHYRLTEKIEAIGQINYGFGTTVYTANGRYSLRNFNLTQAKLELRGDNFMVRGYTTQERSGDSYTAGLTAVTMNEAWKASPTWFGQYVSAYLQARPTVQSDEAAHLAARGVADQGRPLPDTDAYNTLYENARSTPIVRGGGAFLDKSNLYHAEGLYNFKNEIKFADVLIGANVRQYQLGSEGTLFADQVEGRNGQIGITEYGGFLQVSKTFFGEHLKLTGSTRYDKNQNFKGQFTPRVSAVATFGENNFRVSYQTGFRIPTTQNQYIDLQTPQARLVGGLPEFWERYNLANSYSRTDVTAVGAAITAQATNPAFQQQQQQALTAIVQPQVIAAIQQQVLAQVTTQVNAAVAAGQIPASAAPSVIQQQVAAQMASAQVQGLIQQNVTAQVTANLPGFVQLQAINGNIGNLRPYQRKEFRPERVQSYEIGYRGVINKRLFVDAYYYYSVYRDFIGSVVLIQPTGPAIPNVGLPEASGVLSGNTRRVFSMPVNSSERITASGWAIGLNYALNKGYSVSGNLANNQLNDFTPTAELQTAGFNTPKYRWNVAFNKRPTNNSSFGFAVAFRHQDEFVWEGFGQPTEVGVPLYGNTIVPAVNNLDAQVNYKLTKFKSIVKLGATNLFGKPYIQAFGNPSIGSTYYVSLTFDELLN